MLEQQKSSETLVIHLHRGSRKRHHSSAGARSAQHLLISVFMTLRIFVSDLGRIFPSSVYYRNSSHHHFILELTTGGSNKHENKLLNKDRKFFSFQTPLYLNWDAVRLYLTNIFIFFGLPCKHII